jgi:hypothetical protein
MTRFALLSVLMAAVLLGCAETRDDAAWQGDCVAAGYTPGTPEFAECLTARQAEFEQECLSAVAACQ